MTDLFFELFTGLPRQGPGDEGSTLRALGLVPPLGPELAGQVQEEIDVWRRYSDYYAYVFYVMRRIG